MDVPVGKAGHFLLYTHRSQMAFAKMHRSLLDQCHLCMNALMILEVLDQNPKYRTPKDVSRILGLKSNIIYLHVDQLVSDGYLDRVTSETDRRKITLKCTRKAKALLKKADAVRHEYSEHMLSGVSAEDLEAYHRVLRQVEENINDFLQET